MALDKTLAFALVGMLGACGPSVTFDDGNEDVAPDGSDDSGDVFTDGYVNAPGYSAMIPDHYVPLPEGGITGAVYREDLGETSAVDGARVILMTQNETMSTETGYTGTFSFDVKPGHYILVVQAKGFWGVAREIEVARAGLHDLEWVMSIEDAEVQAMAEQVKLPFDTSRGIVSAWFTSAVGGETMFLSASSNPPVTYDENNDPVISNVLLPAGVPMFIFGDIEPTHLTADAIGVAGQSDCAAEPSPIGTWPALPHVVTYVTVVCVVN